MKQLIATWYYRLLYTIRMLLTSIEIHGELNFYIYTFFFFFTITLCSKLYPHDTLKKKRDHYWIIESAAIHVARVLWHDYSFLFLPVLFSPMIRLFKREEREKGRERESNQRVCRIARMLEKHIRQLIFTVLICTGISFAIERFEQRAIRCRI